MWYKSRSICALLLTLATLAAVAGKAYPATAANAVVIDLRVGQHAATTRFVLDFTGRVEFKVFTLADPHRVVIDLSEVGWRLPARPLPKRTGLLQKLRYGLFKPGTSRVVLDVAGPVVVKKAFLLEPRGTRRYRLVVDLAAADSSEPPPPSPAPSAAAIPVPPPKPEPEAVRRVIVVDPGHGGVDPGTTGISGVYEKHVTLAVARTIQERLQRGGRYRVVLTRQRDVFVRLRDRVAFAREAGAELFISLHADAIKDRSISGLSVYTLSETASDKEAALLAERENKADLIAGVDLTRESQEVTSILIDLAQRETMNQSARFAARLVKELSRETKLLRNTHRFAGFAVLKAPDVPSVLLEVGFLSNRRDERALRSKSYRAKLAAAVGRAINRYFDRIEEAARQ